MNDDSLTNLIQKIGHHIDDIRDRSIIMLIQKYEKNLINEEELKKRASFYCLILHYINDRNSFIPLKSLQDILSFVMNIIKKDEHIKQKFEELYISKFLKEFLTHFKNNKEKYKSNKEAQKSYLVKSDDMCMQSLDKSYTENNEYTNVIKILCELINIYCPKESINDILEFKDRKNINIQNSQNTNDVTSSLNTQDLTSDSTNLYNEKIMNPQNDENNSPIKNYIINETNTVQNKDTSDITPKEQEKKQRNSLISLSLYQNNNISEKDLATVNQMIKKNNYINIFTKHRCSTIEDFEYYNILYSIKNQLNQNSIDLLLRYKSYKSNKIKNEDNNTSDTLLSSSFLHTNKNVIEQNYSSLLKYYNFLYLYNFFDSYDMFRKNFLYINGMEPQNNNIEIKQLNEETEKWDVEKKKKDGKKNDQICSITNIIDQYYTYLKHNYIYNNNIYYKITNYTNKINLLYFYTKMKFNYFELLGINIIKKKISVDDLVYMNKEVNKILNKYIYIFNKDVLLFNYKFVYTLSYNIHYIYKNYVENRQLENDYNYIINIVNNLSFIIYIILYNIYVTIKNKKECMCNSIYNIYINNFFFLLNQNLFYLIFLCNSKKAEKKISKNIITVTNFTAYQRTNDENLNSEYQNNDKIISNINSFYYNKHCQKYSELADKNNTLEINENDMYNYLFITKNNCIYIFKMIVFYILEILRISHYRIDNIYKNCSIFNFHTENYILIYDYLYNIMIQYFDSDQKELDTNFNILIDFIKETNIYTSSNTRNKNANNNKTDYISGKKESNNYSFLSVSSSFASSKALESSSSELSHDMNKDKFISIDIFTNDAYRYTYKYNSKQIEILKIICLYINYTPISFIQTKKIKIQFANLLKTILFDIHINTHYLEILYFIKLFFYFYDSQIYKEYEDFIFYYNLIVNLFFIYSEKHNNISNSENENNHPDKNIPTPMVHAKKHIQKSMDAMNTQLDISTFINTNNNIFHFLFFISTNYASLNVFLEKFLAESIKHCDIGSCDSNVFLNTVTNPDNKFSEVFVNFKSSDFENKEKYTKDATNNFKNIESKQLHNFYTTLIKAAKNNTESINIQSHEIEKFIDNSNIISNFSFNFIHNISSVLIENSFKILFNTFLLLSSEYNNFESYIEPHEQYSTIYQFIVDKLKKFSNKMHILSFNHNTQDENHLIQNVKFIELFKNFLLLLYNIISIIYSYNNEVIFFFLNFIFNINNEKNKFFNFNEKLSPIYVQVFNILDNHNCEINTLNKKTNDLNDYEKYIGEYNSYKPTAHHSNFKTKENPITNYRTDYTNVYHNMGNEDKKYLDKKEEYPSNDMIKYEDKTNFNYYTTKNYGNKDNFDYPECHPDYENTQYCENIFDKENREKHNCLERIKNSHIPLKKEPNDFNEIENKYNNNEQNQWNKTKEFVPQSDDNAKNDNLNNYNKKYSDITHSINKAKQHISDTFLSPFQIIEFVDFIYEICVYSKKEIKNYYIVFIIENIKKNINILIDMIKDKEIKEKRRILANIKVYSNLLLLLYFIKKKYIIIIEQTLYNSFNFLYENYFYPHFIQNKKQNLKVDQDSISLYFYQNVFINIHNAYFFLFQKKKKKRTFCLKFFWKLYYQFKMNFGKINTQQEQFKKTDILNDTLDCSFGTNDESQSKEILKRKIQYYNIDQKTDKTYENSKINEKNNTEGEKLSYNIFNYSNDLDFKPNDLNIYITDFLLETFTDDETIILKYMDNISMGIDKLTPHFFNKIISFILRKETKYEANIISTQKTSNHDKEVSNDDTIYLQIYEHVLSLYLQIIKEIILKEKISIKYIEIFIYVLKIIIILLITNDRNSQICKKIYKEKYFFLSHLYCFFFYDNEIIKTLSISLTFYLIFDQNILLLNKYRLFLEPYFVMEQEENNKKVKTRDEYIPFLLNKCLNKQKINYSSQSNDGKNVEYTIIDEITKIKHTNMCTQEEVDNTQNKHEDECHSFQKDIHSIHKKYNISFFNLKNSKSKYLDNKKNDHINNLKRASYYIENKIIYYIPFWLYKKLQPNHLLFHIKKFKSYFLYSTKYTYLHSFHNPKSNTTEKELSYYGNYNNDNIFRSFALFVNKYYYIIQELKKSGNNILLNHNNNICKPNISISPINQDTHSNKSLYNPNSFIFLNIKLDKNILSYNNSAYINSLLKELKIQPSINDFEDDKIKFSYIYNLNRLFFFLNNFYIQFLYTYDDNYDNSIKQSQNNIPKNNTIEKCEISYLHDKSKMETNSNTMCEENINLCNCETKKNCQHQFIKIKKNIYYLFENNFSQILNVINFVYDIIFPYTDKLVFFMYNCLTNTNNTNESCSHKKSIILIHNNLLLLEHLINVFDICLYIHLIIKNNKNIYINEPIHELNKQIDLSLYIYKLLYISISTNSLKNKISSFSLNIIYNFIKIDNYYLNIKHNYYNNLDGEKLKEKETKNYIMLKEEERQRKMQKGKNKSISILVNFLFFIISKYSKKVIKKKAKQNIPNQISQPKHNLYYNIVNLYEIEKIINIENATFQNHEKKYLKLNIFFIKNVMSMLHVIMKQGCYIDINLINNDISFMNYNILMNYDYKRFINKHIWKSKIDINNQHASQPENTSSQIGQNVTTIRSGSKYTDSSFSNSSHNDIQSDSSSSNNTKPGDISLNPLIENKNTKKLRILKKIILNKYINTLLNFCNIYNDIVIECLHVQLLMFFFKYILQVIKSKFRKEYIKDNCYSKQQILIYFFKYYKVDKKICIFLKSIYLIMLKYSIYVQNTKISNDFFTHNITAKKRQIEKHNNQNKETKLDINKHNYFIKEDNIYKNYCKLFYEHTINHYRNCIETEKQSEKSYSYNNLGEQIINNSNCDKRLSDKFKCSSQQNNNSSITDITNTTYISTIDLYCPYCEEIKILFLSIIVFLSFSLDNFPLFFLQDINETRELVKDGDSDNTKNENIIILCERIFYYLSKKNIYRNFCIFREAKLLEKYFIKIFIKLLYCNQKKTMSNLQKYEIYIYKNEMNPLNSQSSQFKEGNDKDEHIQGKYNHSINNCCDNTNTPNTSCSCKNNYYYTKKTKIFKKHMTHDNHFYINYFLNYFLIEKTGKNNLECIYDKIYYYILIVIMCFKDKNFLSVLLSKNENFYDEFNKSLQEYLKYVLKNKQEVNEKKKKNETMIHNLLYIFVSYIYIYLNELYTIFFTHIKNLLTLPSFFQNVIYINSARMIQTNLKNTNEKTGEKTNEQNFNYISIAEYYDILINNKNQHSNNNLENYLDQNIKNVIIRNIFHNNNIYLFILYIMNDNKYNINSGGEAYRKCNSLDNNPDDSIKNDIFFKSFQSNFKRNNKVYLNKITTNIILFFLLFFYDYYSSNYEIKENILMQIVRHIFEHFITFFNDDFIYVHSKLSEITKSSNLNIKKKQKPYTSSNLKYGINNETKIIDNKSMNKDFQESNKNESPEKIDKAKNKNIYLRAHDALEKVKKEENKKREETLKGSSRNRDQSITQQNCKDVLQSKEIKNHKISIENNFKLYNNKKCKNNELNEKKTPLDMHKENEQNLEFKDSSKVNKYIITVILDKLKRNKKLVFLYTTNSFRIIHIHNNVSSLIFTYKYISIMLQKLSYFQNAEIIKCIYNTFDYYIFNITKNEINVVEDKWKNIFYKDIGYMSYTYIYYFFNFISCFLLYDVSTLDKFCSNMQKSIDIINNYLKELITNTQGVYISSIILNFYLTIMNSYLFDFSLYQNTFIFLEKNENTDEKNNLNTKQYINDMLKNNNKWAQNGKKGTYFECIKKLSTEFSRTKFNSFLINYIIDNIETNTSKNITEIKRVNNLIILILQFLSYQIIFIDNKNDILKLANVLMKYLKKKDTCIILSYYIIVFFNSCFLNPVFDERLINTIFNFDKSDNIWFNFIFLSSTKMKKNKDAIILVKFSILHLYLLLLKNKNYFKKCILYISSDINIYFVLIYILNEIFEYFQILNNNEENIIQIIKMDKSNNKDNNPSNIQKTHIKYFYLYTELIVVVTDIIKIINTNDFNKYIALHHNKDKDSLVLQFKNLYKKLKNELKHLEKHIKSIKYSIFIHPLMINIHMLHQYYLSIYIKEFYYFHKTFFKYDLFMFNYLKLIKNKRKGTNFTFIKKHQEKKETGKIGTIATTLKTSEVASENMQKLDLKNNIDRENYINKNKGKSYHNMNNQDTHFYFFFNTHKNFNYQVNSLYSSTLQNEIHYSLSKIFSSSFLKSNETPQNYLQYNMEHIKIYINYINQSVNFSIDFFNNFAKT
ncbi:conserved Plasmodium protein, unknown function [Plasmodium vinckei vinckei]|uniref:Uncharacterized protein n=1 Tax=Plasmodium vinckei vinckei TaxID=54757 RepID=A0A449BXJ1_PLAVN|nr:conserved Plasmodium protein, unknown function [Plasmodium vinckei vinckei]KEG04452.1 hypothetical protein YYE_00025 [Plasmodium vinckei vinckei]VEV58101.1 conserved Plasmodium protein, unknown function [Plasmodium vinckei vinckei]